MRSHPLLPSLAFERFYAVLASLLIFAYIFVSEALYTSITGQTALLACTLVILGTYWHYRVTSRAKQQALNSALVYTNVTASSFYLYLRTFDMAQKIPVRNSVRSWVKRSIIGSFWDIEHSLSIALDATGLLIAIGDKKTSFGAAKLMPTDAEWKARFFDLAQKSRNIFVVPHNSPSTVWEIEQITSDRALAEKTFFLMPPSYWRGGKYTALFFPLLLFLIPINVLLRRGAKHRWDAIRNVARTKGIEFPAYDASGLIFQLSAEGKIVRHAPFNDLDGEYLRTLLASPDAAKKFKFVRPWFDRFPISWTFLAPGAITSVVIALTIATVVRVFFYHPFSISSISSMPTLRVGDYVYVSKFSYGYSWYSFSVGARVFSGRYFGAQPNRGDIAVFKLPSDNSTDYIFRLIGLPGDEIMMRDGALHINGQTVPKERNGEFATRDDYGHEHRVPLFQETLPNGVKYSVLDSEPDGFLDNVGPYKVPAGHFFVMGDNRDNALDSRGPNVRYVPYENFVGRAEIIYFSAALDEPDAWRWTSPWTWPFDIRWSRIFKPVR